MSSTGAEDEVGSSDPLSAAPGSAPRSPAGSARPAGSAPRSLIRRGLDRYAEALLAALVLLVAECVLVALWRRRELVALYELGLALQWLLPLGVLLAALVCAGGAWLNAALAAEPVKRGQLAALALVLMLPVAVGVSGGRMLAGWRRPVFVAVVSSLAVAGAWFGGPWLRNLLAALLARGRGWLLAAVAAALLALELINLRLLVRLYPAFHIGLAVAAVWLAALALWRPAEAAGRGVEAAEPDAALPKRGAGAASSLKWGAPVTLLAVAVSLPLAYLAPQKLAQRDNVRIIYHQHAPLLGRAVELSTWLGGERPGPVDPGQVPDAALAQGPSLPLRGRDVLLITVDALRADRLAGQGYARRTTPQLDALAASGVSFTAAYTPTPHTSYAMTSLMVGKPMRSLLKQGLAGSSETAAQLLRRYDYRTAAFYPPALFFIDKERFTHFRETHLGFEYRKEEFASAAARVDQLRAYLDDQTDPQQRLFVWVHLFEPHEPYVAHEGFAFGERAIDRYDSEVAAADAGIGALVELMRARRPEALVVVSADHGEEFGDHGGHYHGSSVYDEQVRVPLIFQLPGVLEPREVKAPVSLIDVLPTLLGGLEIPTSPRVSGHDLGPLMLGEGEGGERVAFAETDEQSLLARGSLRLICHQQAGACRLFDVAQDPKQLSDLSSAQAAERKRMVERLARYTAALGSFEDAEERKFPRALRRGLAGDRLAAMDVAGLLDDADVRLRRKAAEVLFELREPAVKPHLRRALHRDEDAQVRRYAALALTRLGEGAPLVLDMLAEGELAVRRLAALALAEQGKDRGEDVLVAWLRAAFPAKRRKRPEPIEHARAKQLMAALGTIKSRGAIAPLTRVLRDVRLRVAAAKALAAIGDDAARPSLAKAFANERYRDARLVLAEALVSLGGGPEIRGAFTRFLGVPEPLPDGLELARRAELLQLVGGPSERELRRLREFATSGVTIGLVIPKFNKVNKSKGLRVLVRARSLTQEPGEVRFGLATRPLSDGDRSRRVPKHAQQLDDTTAVTLRFSPSDRSVERYATLPASVGERVEPGEHGDFVVYATQNMQVESCAVVPLRDELAPPPPHKPPHAEER